MILTEHAISAAPLLKAIAEGGDLSNATLAERTGRGPKNMARDLNRLAEAGWITLDPGPALNPMAVEALAAIARAEGVDAPAVEGFAREVPLDLIDEEPGFNPRKRHDPAAHEELTASVRERGVLQPIKVRPSPVEGRFYVVMGSRRRRAAIAAGLPTIRAVVEDVGEAQAFEEAVIENVQREDMTEMEEARAFDRIVKDRMAANTDLKLKDAKEQIAGIIDKTVRYVELRLQLLQLPPAKQEALEDGTLGVTEARKWLQSRPKLLNLTPRQWLIALEVFDAQERRPIAKTWQHDTDATACQADAALDDDAIALVELQFVSEPGEVRDAEDWPTGLYRIRAFDHRLDQLRLKFGEVADEDIRDRALTEIRTLVLGVVPSISTPDGAQVLPPGSYATPWLNGPFEPSEARVAEIAQAKAEAVSQEEARRQEQADAAAAAAARNEMGRRHLTTAELVSRHAWATPPAKPLDPVIEVIFREQDYPLPLHVTPLAGIYAANGRPILYDHPADRPPPPPGTVARMMLMVVALNAAAGLATPQPEPTEEAAPETDAEAPTSPATLQD